MTPLSILDLAPIVEGSDAATALRCTLDLAQHAERWAYRRYWLAEHHNLDGVACSATAVLVACVAGATHTMRVGSGGIMLPNHAPLTVAEAFGTLATLYPGRIDLGLGRAPGTDLRTARALRRHMEAPDADSFAQDVVELQSYLDDAQPGQAVRAIPGTGTQVPIWILGSSLYGAQLAAHLGLPYAFASHFAPELLDDALAVYRRRFRPSARWPRPYAMVGVNVVCAADDDEARFHATSIEQRFLGMVRGERGALPRPVDPALLASLGSESEWAAARRMLACSAVGSAATVRRELAAVVRRTQADELIVAGAIHDHGARLRSYGLLAELMQATGP